MSYSGNVALNSKFDTKLEIREVVLMRHGLRPSVQELLKQGPRSVPNRHGCYIDAAGRVFEVQDGQLVACQRQQSNSGRVYYAFPSGAGEFKLWVLYAMYLAFIGQEVPKGFRVEPEDGDHANTRLDNLVLRLDPDEVEKHFSQPAASGG